MAKRVSERATTVAGADVPSVVASLALFVSLSLVPQGEQGPSPGKEGASRSKDAGAPADRRGARRSARPAQDGGREGGGADGPEIKVVTFNQGTFDPAVLEPIRFWPRGHTAVIIDGEVHSFEADWECGVPEALYKRKNDWRGAWVQVLDLSRAAAERIRANFDRSCGTGAFLLTGVCATSTARLLRDVLGDLEVTWAPMHLRRQLAEGGYVAETHRWHREVWRNRVTGCVRDKTGRRYRGGTTRRVGPGAETAREECLAQLGLRAEDLRRGGSAESGAGPGILARRPERQASGEAP